MAIPATTSLVKRVPFIQEFPVIGSLPAYTQDRLQFYRHLTAHYGDVCGFHLGPLPVLLFNRPEHAHSILVEQASAFEKGKVVHKTVSPFTGEGVFLLEGERHRRQRKLMAPSFQPRHISSYAEAMARYSERFAQKWSVDQVIDINRKMSALTVSIIGKVLFDSEVFDETDELCQAMTICTAHAASLMTSPFTIPFSWPTARNQRTRRAIKTIMRRLQQMIDQRRASPHEHNDALSLLLRARDEEDGSQMSDEQLMSECMTLFGAGNETTASALSWVWFLLATHPEVYRKVQQEVDRVLQGRTPTSANLVKLPYSLQVFKETIRLYPPAYMVLREAIRDVEINGYLVPKGSHVMLAVYTMQRNPEYFPDPDHFDPDRFTLENEKRLPRYTYIPFGGGPRICLGNHFALMEGHLIIATLAQRVTFDLLPHQIIMGNPSKNLTLRPDGRLLMKVSQR